MSKSLGPIEIQCDAPPYSVVRACQRVGMRNPEDVRWVRLSHFLQQTENRRDMLSVQVWKALLGVGAGVGNCSCGQCLPNLERYTFTFRTGNQSSFFLGQCSGCRTIFWEEA